MADFLLCAPSYQVPDHSEEFVCLTYPIWPLSSTVALIPIIGGRFELYAGFSANCLDYTVPTTMDENHDSPTVKSELLAGEDVSFNTHALLTYDYEREIQILERDIRQQKESSVNAKTAITFEQLRKIHNLGKLLGPQKEIFFDRICRAADIQRASLKNRLKQNKEVVNNGFHDITAA
ncbi:unnamed protein product [Strongylus vulgaris]|uniref:Uncharacterized protein n=1 Tax=Strongylus vulgaris TaxID=40348 RepID=A0A3P7I5U8_STRVU|nr:unnamed protein product [Strongylus vulgaris]